MSITVCLLAGLYGCVYGSFLNVFIYRWPLKISLWHPRSQCSSCQTQIAAYDNIPLISYIILRGRCRRCKTHFSSRYFWVELISGVIAAASFLVLGLNVYALGVALQLPLLLALTLMFYDLHKCGLLSDKILMNFSLALALFGSAIGNFLLPLIFVTLAVMITTKISCKEIRWQHENA